jgi:Ca2+-binding EF-hand superfamily protein
VQVVAASRLGREHIPSLHAMFHQLDADHDGQLNAEELQVALQRQGRHVTEVCGWLILVLQTVCFACQLV